MNIVFFAGLCFVFCGLYFKMGLFPFHTWIPDIYQGIPSQIVPFFSVLPQLPLFYIMTTLIQQYLYVDMSLFSFFFF